MMMPTPWLALLLATFGRHFVSSYAQAAGSGGSFDPPPSAPCRTCASQPGCLNVTTAAYPIAGIACSSPLYEAITLATCHTTQMDSKCHTFFQIDDQNFLVFKVIVYTDGSTAIQVYIISDVGGAPGSHRIQGLANDSGCSTLLSQQCLLGVACDDTYVFYKCDYYNGEDNPKDTSQDMRYVLSSNPFIDPCCQNRVQAIFDSRNFCGDDFHNMPYQLVPKCVATFNGAKCINYDRLMDESKINLPGDTDSLFIPGGDQSMGGIYPSGPILE